jgi:ubiquinone/menaquinone biosynthesis C-methylase UbiE
MDDIRSNLSEIWRTNQYFGGIKALTYHLFPLLQQDTERVCIVDIGTGSAQMGLIVARWAAQNGLGMTIYGLDRSLRNLSVSGKHVKSIVHLMQADALFLPFAPNTVDYFISSLFLHHLSPEQVISVLKKAYNLSRRGVVMSDLVRGYLPLLAFHVIQPLFARHYLTQHDGLLSIKRAYSPDELRTLAEAAGLETAHVYSHFPWRMTLVAEKPRV